MECRRCGAEVGEAAAFCPSCGLVLDARRRYKRRWWIVTSILILVIAVLAGSAGVVLKMRNDSSAKARDKAAVVLAPFEKMESALGVGINLSDYSAQLREVNYAYSTYRPEDSPSGEMGDWLQEALTNWMAAKEAWTMATDMDHPGRLSPEKSTGQAWKEELPALDLPDGRVTMDEVRQAAWARATAAVRNARSIAQETWGLE